MTATKSVNRQATVSLTCQLPDGEDYTVHSYSSRCIFSVYSQNAIEYFMIGAILRLMSKGGSQMTDSISQAARSAMMSRIRGKNTGPELAVRKLAFAAGYRYRLHVRRLPGSPDLVFPSRKKVIFVHGCFWHRHDGCSSSRIPKSRVDFWTSKLNGNKSRDARNYQSLIDLGWQVFVVWECELVDLVALEKRLRLFLGPPSSAV